MMKKFEWTMVNALALSVLAFVGIYNTFIANKDSLTEEDNSHESVSSTIPGDQNKPFIPDVRNEQVIYSEPEKSISIDTSHGKVVLINFTKYFQSKASVTEYPNQPGKQSLQLELTPKGSFKGNILAYAFGDKGKICPENKFCYENRGRGVKRCASYQFDVRIPQADSPGSRSPFDPFAPLGSFNPLNPFGLFGPQRPSCFEGVADLDPDVGKFSFTGGRKINAWIHVPFNTVNRLELTFSKTP